MLNSEQQRERSTSGLPTHLRTICFADERLSSFLDLSISQFENLASNLPASESEPAQESGRSQLSKVSPKRP